MKLSFYLLTLTLFHVSVAVPTAIGSASDKEELEARAEKCIVANNLKFYGGTCVDTRQAKQCAGGLLVTGWCGGGNTNSKFLHMFVYVVYAYHEGWMRKLLGSV